MKLETHAKVLDIGKDKCEQIVQFQLRLFQKEQSDQILHCLLFYLHLLDAKQLV